MVGVRRSPFWNHNSYRLVGNFLHYDSLTSRADLTKLCISEESSGGFESTVYSYFRLVVLNDLRIMVQRSPRDRT